MSANIPVAFTIEYRHIEEMMQSLDSGMCDPSRVNAICQALQAHVTAPEELRVHFRRGLLCANLRGEWVELPETLASWLQGAFRGLTREPGKFHASLPAHWLIKSVDRSANSTISSKRTNSLKKEIAAA